MQERLSKGRDRERSGLARGLRSAIKQVGHAVVSFLGESSLNTHRAEKKGWAIHNSTKLNVQSSHVQLNDLSRVMQSGVIGHQERRAAPRNESAGQSALRRTALSTWGTRATTPQQAAYQCS